MSQAQEPLTVIKEEQLTGPHEVVINIRYFCKVGKAARLSKLIPDKAIYDFLDEYLKLQRQYRK